VRSPGGIATRDALGGSFSLASATGNNFLLWDRVDDHTPEEAARAQESDLAQRICRELTVDGVLTLAAPLDSGDLRMVLHNADGGRAEACGNGLRVLACAWHGRRSSPQKAPERSRPAVVETDAGPRDAWALAGPDGVARSARVSLGEPRLVSIDESLSTPHGPVLAHLADVGNPHCVIFVADLARVDFARLGPALEFHRRFPERTNVEFVERDANGLRLRVWERGVGETGSCGSGAVAAAFVARELHGLAAPVRVEMRGGHLRVSFTDAGTALLEGPAEVRPLGAEQSRLLLSSRPSDS
jgi:diaminopimelate epimerase